LNKATKIINLLKQKPNLHNKPEKHKSEKTDCFGGFSEACENLNKETLQPVELTWKSGKKPVFWRAF